MSVFEHIKSTFKQTSILTATAVLQKSIGFIMLPIYAHYLKGEGYGVLGMLGVLTQLMTVVIGSGLAGGIQRYYFLEVSDFDKNRIVSTGILLLFLLSICISIPALMGSRLISWLLFGKQDFAFFVVLTVITFIANISSYGGEAYILVRKKIYFYSILSLTRFSIALGLNIYLIVYRQMGVLGAICTNLVAATFVSLAINLKSLFSVGLHFEWNAAKKILKYNLPMVPGFILWFVKNNMDKIILRSFLGVEFLGVYMMLRKFVSLITVFITEPFLKIWNVKRLEVCEKEEGPRLMAKVFNLQTSMVLFLGLVLSIEIPYILQIMTPEEFWLPGLYALFAILQPILYGIYHHLNFGIIYSKQTYKFSIITFITASISFLANYFLIKEFGLLGALIASVLVYSSQVFVTYLLSRKLYFIPFEWFKLLWFGFGFIVLFFLIDSVSIQQLDFTIYIAKKVKPTLITCLNLFDLGDNIIVKILTYSIYNLEIFFEAFIKGGLTLSFIILLLFAGIVPKRLIREIIHLSFRVKSFNFLSK